MPKLRVVDLHKADRVRVERICESVRVWTATPFDRAPGDTYKSRSSAEEAWADVCTHVHLADGVERVVACLVLVRCHGYSPRAICGALGMSMPTIHRILTAFRELEAATDPETIAAILHCPPIDLYRHQRKANQ